MTRKGKLALGLVLVLCVVLAVYALVPRSLTYASGIDPAQTERLEVYLLGIREDDSYHMTLSLRNCGRNWIARVMCPWSQRTYLRHSISPRGATART